MLFFFYGYLNFFLRHHNIMVFCESIMKIYIGTYEHSQNHRRQGRLDIGLRISNLECRNRWWRQDIDIRRDLDYK